MATAKSKLEIIIDVITGRSGQKIGELETKTRGLRGSFKDLTREVPGLGSTLGILTNPLTLVGAGIFSAGKFAANAAKETVEYNKQIRELSTALGVSAEETSRIVQVSDDWGISVEQVRTALTYMTKNGVQPTIENLADLADEFVNTKDRTEFAERAAKLMGREWTKLIPILKDGGDSLREQAGAVNANLIATDAAIASSRAYEVAVDDLTDAWQGFKYQIGNEVIPVLIELVTAVNEGMTASDNYYSSFDQLRAAFDRGVISEQEFMKTHKLLELHMIDALEVTELLDDRQQKYNKTMGLDAPDMIDRMKASYESATAAANDNAEANSLVAIAIGDVTRAALGKTALDALTKAYQDGTLSEADYEREARGVMDVLLELPPNTINAQLAIQNLTQDLEAGKISPQEYAAALKAMADHMDYLNGKSVTSTVEVIYKNTYVSSGKPTIQGSQLVIPGGQHGLNMIVPPGYPNDRYQVRASSGEQVSITPRQGNTYNQTWNIYSNAGMQAAQRDYNMRRALAR